MALADRSDALSSYRPPYDIPDFTAEELQCELRDALHRIGARNRLIVIGRVTRTPPVTLQALATELGLSRERVRQLEPKAVEKLKRVITREQPAAVTKLLAQLRHFDLDGDLEGVITACAPVGTSPAALALIAHIADR